MLRYLVVAAAVVAAAVPSASARRFQGHPGCSWRPFPAAARGTEYAKYLIPHGCAWLVVRAPESLPYLPFYRLRVRWRGRATTFPFPWPAFSKIVAGACRHGDYARSYSEAQWFTVAWPFVTYSIPLCANDGTPVRLGTLGGSNRATGIFRILVSTSGRPRGLEAVAVPPEFSPGP